MVALCGEILRKYRWVGLIFRNSSTHPAHCSCGNSLCLISVSLSLFCWKEIKMCQAVSGIGPVIIGNLSINVFERRTSTGSEAFFLFLCLDAIKFSLLTFFSLLKTIYPRVLTKPLLNDAKSPLPVDVRRLKTLLLKVPNQLALLRPRLYKEKLFLEGWSPSQPSQL